MPAQRGFSRTGCQLRRQASCKSSPGASHNARRDPAHGEPAVCHTEGCFITILEGAPKY